MPEEYSSHKSRFFLVAYIAALALLFMMFRDYFTFLVLGSILVVFLAPVNRFVKRYIPNATLSSLLMTFILIMLILIPGVFLVLGLSEEIVKVQDAVNQANWENMSQSVNSFLGTEIDFESVVRDSIGDLRSYVATAVPNLLGSFTQLIIKFFLMFYLAYYGFKEGETLKAGVMEMLPLSARHKKLLQIESRSVLYGVMYGQVLVSLLQGLLGGLSIWIFGLSNPILWGFAMAIFAFIPLLGTPFVYGPVALIAFVQGDTGAALGVLIFNTVLTTNIDNVLKPKLIGTKTSMHPLVILLSILGGLNVFGFIGLIVGPIVVAIALQIVKIYVTDFNHSELAGEETEPSQDGLLSNS